MCRFANGRLQPSSISAFRLVGSFGDTATLPNAAALLDDVPIAKRRRVAVAIRPVSVAVPSGAVNATHASSESDSPSMQRGATLEEDERPHSHDDSSDHADEGQAPRYALATFKSDGTDRRHTYATGSRHEAPVGFEEVGALEPGHWLLLDKMNPAVRDHVLFIDEVGILRRYYTVQRRNLSDAYAAGIPVFWPLSSLRLCVRKHRLVDASLSRSARVSSSNLKRTVMNKCRCLVTKGAAPWSLFGTCTPTGTVHMQYVGAGPLSYKRFSELKNLLTRLNEEHDLHLFAQERDDIEVPNLDELRVYARHIKGCLSPDLQKTYFPTSVASMTTALLQKSIASVRSHLRDSL